MFLLLSATSARPKKLFLPGPVKYNPHRKTSHRANGEKEVGIYFLLLSVNTARPKKTFIFMRKQAMQIT